MAALAESSLDATPLRQWVIRIAIVIGLLALVSGAALAVHDMLRAPAGPKRQVAKISILPDTPPPPPPPVKEEKRPEPPKVEAKQVMRDEQVKQDAPKVADAPIKMDGPAGDGPSAFAAGTVSNEYRGGTPVVGSTGSVGGGVADRAQERFYANSVKQLLRDEIEKHLPPNSGELTASFSIWIEANGSVRRFELVPTGDAARDNDLRTAFEQAAPLLRLPSPNGLPQPLRFKLSMRPA